MTSRQQALYDEVGRFVRNTTVRGITRIANAENGYALRCLWVIAFIAAAAITVYQLSAVVIKYLLYEETVNLNYLQLNPEFPDISACRVNPYGKSWVNPRRATFDEYYSFVQQLQTDVMDTDGKKWNLTLSSYDNFKKIIKFLNSPTGYFANLELNGIELQLNTTTMIRELSYYSWDLLDVSDHSDFAFTSLASVEFNADYQKCFRLHVPDNEAHNIRAMTGIFFTLDFPSDSIRTFDTNLRMSLTSGVNILLHRRGAYPDSMLGVIIAPGQETTITVQPTVVQRLGYPYDDCENFEYLTESGHYEPGALRYTVDACYDLCFQRHIMRTCKCIDCTKTFTPVEQKSGLPMCGNMNFTHGAPPTRDSLKCAMDQLECYFKTIALLKTRSSKTDCHCPRPCLEYNYETKLFSAPWPHRSYQLAFYEDFIKGKAVFGTRFDIYPSIANDTNLTAVDRLNILNSTHLIEQNFLRIKVIIKDRAVQTLNSTPALTWEGLASNVGGSLSLWIGVTVMTLFELVELVVRLVKLAVARYEEKKETKQAAKDVFENIKVDSNTFESSTNHFSNVNLYGEKTKL